MEGLLIHFSSICVRQNVDVGTREMVESCHIAKKQGLIKIGFVCVNVAFFIQQLQRISPLEKTHVFNENIYRDLFYNTESSLKTHHGAVIMTLL